ncbi:hypothetical protein [Defluviimonas salinarum]|uniref:Uncharacterized protein n=1 Tax=Defluviimonas salinarum TaxID=2992147 RepID=A0ABT3JAN1_9RHOB|nr:hypothetical protein [Defluviimonas salinarum]MCW3784763.1 hypothetical protein [Defluviimonas salinarum]
MKYLELPQLNMTVSRVKFGQSYQFTRRAIFFILKCGTPRARWRQSGVVAGVVALIRERTEIALTGPTLGNGFDLGGAECIEPVHDGDADLDFGGLTVGVS